MADSVDRPRWRAVVVLGATLLGMAVTASLGRWQLDRAAQKEALQSALRLQAALPVVSLNDLAAPPEAADTHWLHRRAQVRGRWLPQHTVFLDNRQMQGPRPGFFVLTPLQIEGREDVLVVQRGWVPRDVRDRRRLPEVNTPRDETVSLTGRIAPPPARLYQFSTEESGAIRQNIVLAQFAQEIHRSVWPVTLVQTEPSSSEAGDELLRQWPEPSVDVHKHYGYAFQWFALCALMAGLYVWFQVLRPWRRRRA
jgi:surfeit locus 1 family protein